MAAHDRKDEQFKGKTPKLSELQDDPLREGSTDFRGAGEKFEVVPEGENLDLDRMDQPRRNLEKLPKAQKDKARVPAPNAGGKSKKDHAA